MLGEGPKSTLRELADTATARARELRAFAAEAEDVTGKSFGKALDAAVAEFGPALMRSTILRHGVDDAERQEELDRRSANASVRAELLRRERAFRHRWSEYVPVLDEALALPDDELAALLPEKGGR